MNRTQLVERIATRSGSSKAEVRRVLEALAEVGIEALGHGESVQLAGLGSLELREQQPRTIRSIADMRRMRLGRRFTTRFRPSSRLRQAVQSLGGQEWRAPEHQAAWRLAETLVSDLDLYHGKRAPKLSAQAEDADVHDECEHAFGGLWTRVQDSFLNRTPPEVRSRHDYLAEAARQRWSA